MEVIGTFLAGAALAAGVFAIALLLTRRRDTPYLELDPDRFPPISDGIEMLSGLTQSSLHENNTGRVLQNGAAYPAMLADIENARHSVHLETFVWSTGELEHRFVEILSARARAGGCEVRVLLDAIGASRADPRALDAMREAGVEVTIYCRPRWWNWLRFNHRTHRKLLVVDGRIGWTFGHGIADQWLGDGTDPDHWRDTAIRLEGPIVHALQSVFVENWVEELHRLPAGNGCWPTLDKAGHARAHVVSSASGESVSSVAMLYTIAIASARREVLIQNPYFAPDDGVVDLFAMMVERGVDVQLMVPGKHTDSPFVRRAGCHLYEKLLRAGVRIFEFEPTLLHQKIVIVDELWAHVGSTNFDSRSLALNEEVGVGILDAGIASELKDAYLADMEHCRELDLDRWLERSAIARLVDRFAYLLHDQL
ncbi:MAG TPA: phospholipase D-like domain-containing protein [Steroidobacteraceae bacterium]|nr:phospholipase D-like domain-containing protein [Steroidobacteraceae bacterium]